MWHTNTHLRPTINILFHVQPSGLAYWYQQSCIWYQCACTREQNKRELRLQKSGIAQRVNNHHLLASDNKCRAAFHTGHMEVLRHPTWHMQSRL